MLKKQSIGFLIIILLIICVYLFISNITLAQYLITPIEAVEKSLCYFKEANTVNVNSKMAFNLENQTGSQSNVYFNPKIIWNKVEGSFNANLSSLDGIVPEIQIEYKDQFLNIEIPGIVSENIQFIKDSDISKTQNTDENFKRLIQSLSDAGKIRTSITSSNVLFDRPDKRDRKEWVIKTQIDISMYDLLNNIPEISLSEEDFLNRDTQIPINPEVFENMKNTNLIATLITTVDMQPRLFELVLFDDDKSVMVLSGEITME